MINSLLSRSSHPANQLLDPAPDEETLNTILQCAVTAADHAMMRPWRFITISGDARIELGKLFARAAKKDDPDILDAKLERISEKPMRSPLIVVIVATITRDHPKTPEVEQILSAGAAATQMQLAAYAAGFGAVWLTGPNAYNETIKAALGVESKDHIIGFMYMGTPATEQPVRKRPEVKDLVSHWEGDLKP